MDGSDAPDGHIPDDVVFGQHIFPNSGRPTSTPTPRVGLSRPPQAVPPPASYSATPPPASYGAAPGPWRGLPGHGLAGQWPGTGPAAVATGGQGTGGQGTGGQATGGQGTGGQGAAAGRPIATVATGRKRAPPAKKKDEQNLQI